jgi:hypothetical protein
VIIALIMDVGAGGAMGLERGVEEEDGMGGRMRGNINWEKEWDTKGY